MYYLVLSKYTITIYEDKIYDFNSLVDCLDNAIFMSHNLPLLILLT